MKIKIVPHQIEWKEKFEKEKRILKELIPIPGLKIEHIGSTSVEGMAAKPVVDIMLGVKNNSELEQLKNALYGQPNYVYYSKWEPVMPFRKFFVKLENVPQNISDSIPIDIKIEEDQPETILQYRGCHIHSVVHSHPFWEKHIAFRNHLRNDPETFKKYQDLKFGLSQKEWERSEDFSKAKTAFILSVLKNLGF